MLPDLENLPDDLASLPQIMASTYYVNLSIFRSAPDSWSIKQLFPIMPIHRLQEEPKVKGILADITCDSDGKIDRFVDRKTTKSKNILELHSFDHQLPTPYCLGMFLVGAYQEIMGNSHNLFGDTNVVQVKTTADGYQVESIIQGDKIKSVLGSVQYDSKDLLAKMSSQTELARQNQHITAAEAER